MAPNNKATAASELLAVATECHTKLSDALDNLGYIMEGSDLKSGAAFCRFGRTNLEDAIWWLQRIAEPVRDPESCNGIEASGVPDRP